MIHVEAGAYFENITVNKSLNIDGAGEASVTIYPAFSDVGIPNPDAGPSFRGSQVVIITATDVTLSNLTVDGDNSSLTGGIIRHGADIDARNGIITGALATNLVVHHVTVKNIYLRGLYSRDDNTTFHFHHCTVQNVDGGASSIALFAWHSSGIVEYNTVSLSNDGIAANHSKGIQFLYNVVNTSGTGLHTDNNNSYGDGVADVLQYNQVDDCSYGIFVFFPNVVNPLVDNNTISGCYVGLMAWGTGYTSPGTATFTNNAVDCEGLSGSVGIYVTPGPDAWLSWQQNVVASFTGNSVSDADYGFWLETDESVPADFSCAVSAATTTFSACGVDVGISGVGSISYSGLFGGTTLVGCPGRVQDGINLVSPGGIASLSACVYHERVNINKALSLRGAQFGVDPTATGARVNPAAESIIDLVGVAPVNPNVMVEIPAGIQNATISGLTLNGSTVINWADESTIRCWDDHVTIEDNIMDGYTTVLYKGNDYLTVQRNRIVATKQCVVVQPNPATNVDVTDNVFGPNATPAADCKAVYLTGTANSSVTGNVAAGFPGGEGVSGSNNTQLLVSGNSFTGTRKGVSLWGTTTFVTISDNDISGSTFSGIDIKGSDLTITGNSISANGSDGIQVAFHVIPTERVTIFNNSIFGNAGFELLVAPAVTDLVDASGNWWGDDQPDWGTTVSGLADFTPWMANDGTYGTPGFDGDFSTLYVDDLSAQVGALGRVQEGVNLVTASTVYIMPGTYNENVVLNSTIVLDGAGSGSNPISNSIIDPTSGIGIIVNASGSSSIDRLIIKDLRVTGATNGIDINAPNASFLTFDNVACVSNSSHGVNTNPVDGSGNFSDLKFINCDLSSNGNTGLRFASYVGANGLEITGGQMNGNAYGMQDYMGVGKPILTNVTVTGTSFNNNMSRGLYIESLDNATFTDVVVSNSGTSGAYAAGIDVNLKYASYSNLTFSNLTVTNCGTGDLTNGTGLTVKGRNDGTYAPNPGSLTTLNVIGGTYTGCPANLSIGNNVDDTDISSALSGNGGGGIVVWVDPGKAVSVTDNSLSSNTVNAFDNTSGHTWDGNCYSDFVANPGYSAQYDISGGGGNVDYNPNPNGCGDLDFLASAWIGCFGGTCPKDTLYLTFNQAAMVTGKIFVKLPAEFDADWATDPGYPGANHNVGPATNIATNLLPALCNARRSALNEIEVNVAWNISAGGSMDLTGTQYIACIPLKNVSGAHNVTYTVSGDSSRFRDVNAIWFTNLFMLGTVDITVDCAVPVASFVNTATCSAFGNSTQMEGMLPISVLRGAGESPLYSVTVTYGPNTMTLVPPAVVVDYVNATFPDAGQAAAIWAWMSEGCNTVTLNYSDTECNSGTSLLTLVKDTSAPVFTTETNSNPAFVYNNTTGPTLLDDYLEVCWTLWTNSACEANTGELFFGAGIGGPWMSLGALSAAGGCYLISDAEAAAVWNYILMYGPAFNYVSFNIFFKVEDCAENGVVSGPFTIWIDNVDPSANTVSFLDARPTSQSVWLKWSWAASNAEAVKMEVWRSPVTIGAAGYPTYTGAIFDVVGNYPTIYPPAGFTKVAEQTGVSGTLLSDTYTGAPNDHNSTGDYWRDDGRVFGGGAPGWPDGGEARDVYRYVTFVQDAGGNWSSSAIDPTWTSPPGNADRATNYWLGDFAPVSAPGLAGSRGYVDTDDLGFLASNYFTAPAGSPFCDIGPESEENGVGKGVPYPDNEVDFDDLVPFSFEYGIVAPPIGLPGEFRITPSPREQPFRGLDELPTIVATVPANQMIEVGKEFVVTIALSGNSSQAVKAAEAILSFDGSVLEFVSSTDHAIDVTNGTPWSKSALISGADAGIGVVAAALGESGMISGDPLLATITFRWKDSNAMGTEIALTSIKLADGTGAILESEGSTLSFGARVALPTVYALYQNYPNPFNPATTIRFDLPEHANVQLTVYNTTGQIVRTLVAGELPAGSHRIQWDGRNDGGRTVGSGLYVYRLNANDFVSTHKMLLTR